MGYLKFRKLVAVLIFAAQSWAVHAQAPTYNPFFVTSTSGNSGNLYWTDLGLLTLPTINIVSSGNGSQLLFNAVLRHQGGVSFELESVDELLPEQECTRAEVSAAIPLLDLTMTVAQAEELIGCSANLQYGQTDLETGRQVFAAWSGNDGVPNSFNGSFSGGYIAGGSSTWIGGTANGAFHSGTIGAPSIQFSLRENVLESISYSLSEQFSICDTTDLLEAYRQINIGDEYASMVASLSCEGNLQLVTFDQSNLQQEYIWYASSPNPAASLALFSQSDTETILATVVDNHVQQLSYSASRQVSSGAACTVEDLVLAESEVQVGQQATDLGDLLDCGSRSESVSINSLSERTNYSWQTAIPNESLFYSVNRSLFISVENGVVVSVRLRRQ